jgi:hypothetical protein
MEYWGLTSLQFQMVVDFWTDYNMITSLVIKFLCRVRAQ